MLLASDWRLNGVATEPISSLTPVTLKVAPLVPTTLTVPVGYEVASHPGIGWEPGERCAYTKAESN